MEPVTAQALEEKLKRELTVEVSGMLFRIRRASLLFLADETDGLWQIARQSREQLVEKIKELIANPSLTRMRRVLLAGVVQPKLAAGVEEDAVCVDLVLADHELSAGLFISIVNFSLEAGESR